MLLEKYGDFLEFVIQSSRISFGHIMCGLCKTKH